MTQSFQIGSRLIGTGQPVFVVAEIGFNHNGDPRLAEKMIRAAAEASADAVKLQTFTAERFVADRPASPGAESPVARLKPLELPRDAYAGLRALAEGLGIVFFSTPFDEANADFLDHLGVPLFKIASGDITHWPLIRRVAAKKKPVILSTGMASLGEVEEAIGQIRAEGNERIVVLQCTSSYPCEPEDTNLRAMETLAAAFGLPVGFSDHTLDNVAALGAVALGACVVEKHFTLDRGLPGVDQQMSMDPAQLRELVRDIRRLERELGHPAKQPAKSELLIRDIARRSLVAARDIPRGTTITAAMLLIKRPGGGVAPRDLERVVGRVTRRDIAAEEPITWDMV